MTIIGLDQAQELLESSKSITVVDVRKPEEFDEGHLANAILVDVTDENFEQDIQRLDRSGEYLVYCKLGGRSAKAVEIMTELGFANLHDLEGGFTSWADADLPIAEV